MKTIRSLEATSEIMVSEAIRSLTEKPVLTTTLERVRLFHEAGRAIPAGEAQPIKYGRGLYYVLERISLPVQPHDLLLGRVSEEVPDEEGERFFRSVHNNFARPEWIDDYGHCSFSWQELIDRGLPQLREDARRTLDRQTASSAPEEAISFMTGALLVFDALLLYIRRYAQAAEKAGMEEAAQALYAIAEREPRSFRECLQLLWIITLVYCTLITVNATLALGRPDCFLEKLYLQDIASGRLTRGEARLLILDFYCKNNLILGRGEHQMGSGDPALFTDWARILASDAPQYLVLGGRRPDGSDLAGELTELFIEAIEPRFKNPVISFHYAPDFQSKHPDLWKLLVRKIRQSASILVYHEENVINAYLRMGADREDAVRFEHYGCNHPCLPGIHGEIEIIRPNPVQALMDILARRAEEGREPGQIEEIYEDMVEWTREMAAPHAERIIRTARERAARPWDQLLFCDCFFRDAMKTGQSHRAGGSKYQQIRLLIAHPASLVDCVTAVDDLVIRRRKMTLRQMMDALAGGPEEHAVARALMKAVPKLGSDDPLPNLHARNLIARISDTLEKTLLEKFAAESDIRLLPIPSMQTDNAHIDDGRALGATPDGRDAGAPLSQNSGPSEGASVNGLTARLRSLTSFPFDRFAGGAQNLAIRPNTFEGEEGLTNLAALLGGYFDLGGLQLQVSATDAGVLRDAQLHPDAHRDLLVRITGYSAVFIDMTREGQNEIIRREETNC